MLRSPSEFLGDAQTGFVTATTLEVMELGEPDASGRRRPVATGGTEVMKADLVIMALGNDANPIIKNSEPRLHTSKWGTIDLDHQGSQETTLAGCLHRWRRGPWRLDRHTGGRATVRPRPWRCSAPLT